MRWFTCTPVAFGGGEDFFTRDSGLLSRGFQALGVESRAVMPLPARPDDLPSLIRTEFRNLESAAWWRGQQLDGVVLYAWGRPQFHGIAAAIREAGAFLVLNQDSSGAISPLGGLGAWLEDQWVHAAERGGGAGRVLRFAARAAYGMTAGIPLRDLPRAGHLRHGNVIGAVSPLAADRYRRHCRIVGGRGLAARVRLVPHPVAPHFCWNGRPKGPAVVAVGRWHARAQKRPDLLCAAIDRLAGQLAAARFDVVGEPTPEMRAWHDALPAAVRAKACLLGRLPNHELAAVYQNARVLLCPSSFESFHIASAEALCCGCSVAGVRLSTVPSLQWFAAEDGSLAPHPTAAALAEAAATEWRRWDAGERDPQAISRRWCARLHAPNVARQVIGLAEGNA